MSQRLAAGVAMGMLGVGGAYVVFRESESFMHEIGWLIVLGFFTVLAVSVVKS